MKKLKTFVNDHKKELIFCASVPVIYFGIKAYNNSNALVFKWDPSYVKKHFSPEFYEKCLEFYNYLYNAEVIKIG